MQSLNEKLGLFSIEQRKKNKTIGSKNLLVSFKMLLLFSIVLAESRDLEL